MMKFNSIEIGNNLSGDHIRTVFKYMERELPYSCLDVNSLMIGKKGRFIVVIVMYHTGDVKCILEMPYLQMYRSILL